MSDAAPETPIPSIWPDGGPSDAFEALRAVKTDVLDPKTLTTKQRRECVAVLYAQGWPQVNIASLFKVHRHTIQADMVQIDKEWVREFKSVKVEALAGRLLHQASQLAHKAASSPKQGGPSAAFKIIDGYLARMQSLGLLPSVNKLQVTGEDGGPVAVSFSDFIKAATNGKGKVEVVEPGGETEEKGEGG